ncbi:MAG: hypothetical protein QM638_04380 [Nocardioides sp.]|uniref:hypothetical protein n=1 Tax=Nocardioides sp. TaxID=35761 RepID=UPI0039E4034A
MTLIDDPRVDEPSVWTVRLFGWVIGWLVLAGAALWAARQASGTAAVLLVAACGIALLAALGLLVSALVRSRSAGAFDRWMEEEIQDREAARGRSLVVVRVPVGADPLQPELVTTLAADGVAVVWRQAGTTTQPASYALASADPAALADRVREEHRSRPLPAGSYLWLPEPTSGGAARGRRIDL